MRGNRAARLGIGAVAIATVAIAVMHVPAVRSLVGASGCPWGGRTASAAELQAQRVTAAARLRGSTPARARPAHGFSLDETGKADVTAWAARTGARCSEELSGVALRCLETGQDTFFRFDPAGTLVGVDIMHDGTSAAAAAAVLVSVKATITAAVGEDPHQTRGESTASWLEGGYLAQTAAEFRFADYAADVSATNFGERGVIVREQYRSLPRP